MNYYARIVLPLPIDREFHYIIPPDMKDLCLPGVRVQVPFGRRTLTGFCVGVASDSPVEDEKLKEIIEIVDQYPMVVDKMLDLTRWLSTYYTCSWGEALEAVLPRAVRLKVKSKEVSLVKLCSPENVDQEIELLQQKYPTQSRVLRFLKDCDGELTITQFKNKAKISDSPLKTLKKKGFVTFLTSQVTEDPFSFLGRYTEKHSPQALPQLTIHQNIALNSIRFALDKKEFGVVLLYGVTSSGKTEVYLRAIEEVVKKGMEAIVLVPEIALTPQTVSRFKARFENVAVLHSELTEAQRSHEWHIINNGNIQVVIGARSAVFAPTKHLGLIIVDEEHEPSFKQQNMPRYHARDLAVKRAQLEKAVVILGSATPSLESYHNAVCSKYKITKMPKRIGAVPLPRILLVNMRDEFAEQKAFVYFSRSLLNEIQKVLSKKEQAILFLNRRGFATSIHCPRCGYLAKCRNCDIALTYHKRVNRAICHYCNYEITAPSVCPECFLPGIQFFGAGTQRVEEILGKKFPSAKIVRVDSDSMTGRGKYEEVFGAFEKKEIDILIGTQMIAKGLDFPNVTLVGVISVDTILNLPDFRSAERTFQLIVQVAGRAGRGDKGGIVVVQTFHPEHYSIQTALTHNYEAFATRELECRKNLGYPPFGRLMRIIVEGKNEEQVKSKIGEIAQVLIPLKSPGKLSILGPSEAPISMLQGRYRWHLVVKADSAQSIINASHIARPFLTTSKSIKVILDIDPTALL